MKSGGSSSGAVGSDDNNSNNNNNNNKNDNSNNDNNNNNNDDSVVADHRAATAAAAAAAPSSFAELPSSSRCSGGTELDDRLIKAAERQSWYRPTAVQAAAIPLALQGRDVLVRAATGTGKTLTYCLPVLQKILKNGSEASNNNVGGVNAVILVPTRELCDQVHDQLVKLTYYCDDVITVASLSSGNSNSKSGADRRCREEAALRDGPAVIVATPGSLLRHLENSKNGASFRRDLKETVSTLVVDEADLVLSFGYADDVTAIVRRLPRIYQGMLLSATLSADLDSLKSVCLHSPVVVKLDDDEDDDDDAGSSSSLSNRKLKQYYVVLPEKDKRLLLYVLLKLGVLTGKGLFFVNTTDAAYRLKLFFEQFFVRSAVLCAELPVNSRLNIVEQFNVGNFDYLIATDASANVPVAPPEDDDDDDDDDDEEEEKEEEEEHETNHKKEKTKSSAKRKKKKKKPPPPTRADAEYGVSRGTDFRDVSFVVNVGFPATAAQYRHRVGRTARGAGKTGVALSLVSLESAQENDALTAVRDDQPAVDIVGSSGSSRLVPAPAAGTDEPQRQGRRRQRQPVPLDFDLREMEGFRYRVEDVGRAVTRTAVREARAADFRAEVLNSERLTTLGGNIGADGGGGRQNDDEDGICRNKNRQLMTDLQLLRHDRWAGGGGGSAKSRCSQPHLKHVPKYLLPKGMRQVANLHKKKRKKRKQRVSTAAAGAGPRRRSGTFQRRTDNDPLQSFEASADLDGVAGSYEDDDDDDDNTNANGEGVTQDDDPFAEFMNDDDDYDDDNDNDDKRRKKRKAVTGGKVVFHTRDGTGDTTSGRNQWKQRHRKGQFSSKRRKSERRKASRQPLGI